jgi:hypothetical protein
MMTGMHPWIGLADDVRLGLLTQWVSAELVDEVLAECGVRDQRPGALPARFMVYYVLALALFQTDSYDDVAENLVGALEGMDEAIPNRSSFTRARQRLGAGVIEAVFRRLAGPVAPPGLAGAFWRGMRVAAVDGFTLDVPDTEVNRAAFGGPVDAKGQPAGFPQARVVTLTETGTHSPIDARVGAYGGGEPELAIAMAGSAAGMLVIMDRGFPGVALWKAYTQARAHLLIRARSSVARRPVQVLKDGTYLARMNLAGQKGAHPGGVLVRVIEYRVDGGEVIRLLTDLMDPVAFPAGELAALYQERWESEGSFRQVKTFQRGPQEILRSADPELVRQEVWAHLAVHYCLTRMIMRLAAGERIDPDRISFVKVLKHVRRSVIRQSAQTSVQIKQVMAMLAAKVRRKLDNGIRRLREADRSLKRPASKYSFRTAGQVRRPTRRVAAKVLTLHPAIVQLVKQRHCPVRRKGAGRLVRRSGRGERAQRVDDHRAGRAGLPGHGTGLRAGEDQPGRAVVQDAAGLGRAELPVHRDRRRASVDHGQVRDGRLRAVLRHDRDSPVRAEISAQDRVDRPVHHDVEVGPVQALRAICQRPADRVRCGTARYPCDHAGGSIQPSCAPTGYV